MAPSLKLAKDRQELLKQQIVVANSQTWFLENKEFLVGASPDGEESEPKNDDGNDDAWYEGYHWDS